MESTTLRIRIAGSEFFLSCRRREKFCIGSEADCKLSLDGDGIFAEHCEVERVSASGFAVRCLDADFVGVNGRSAAETVVESPFTVELGDVELEAELVPDEEAEGFEEVEVDEDCAEAPVYTVYHDGTRREEEAATETNAGTEADAEYAEPTASEVVAGEEDNEDEKRAADETSAHHSRIRLAAAIPAIRFGARLAAASVPLPRAAPEGSEPANGAIPLPPPGARAKKRKRQSAPSPVRKASATPFVVALVCLCVTGAAGFGWFTWRKLTLPKRPDLLRTKADEGDASAMATLGLSHVRGEWNCEIDVAAGIRMIERSARMGSPLGLLALGWLRREGYDAEPGSPIRDEGFDRGHSAWRQALSADALAAAAETDDPRWIALAGWAEFHLHGRIERETSRLLKKAASRDYPEIARLLSETADGPAEKEKWLREAVEDTRSRRLRDSVYATRISGELHLDEKFPGGDPLRGAEQLERAARAGDPVAQYRWALVSEQEGEDEDALRWAEKASESGLLPGRALLADYFLRGVGTRHRPERAVALAREAVEAGIPRGFRVLASAYADGSGVTEDPGRAAELLRELAATGDARANAELGHILLESDRSREAVDPLRRAAEAGNAQAALALGKALTESGDSESLEEAVPWLEKALDSEQPGAALALADAVDHPNREARDPARAAEVLGALADEGNHACGVRLSQYYLDGRGVDRDSNRALLLLRKAADADEPGAFFPLGQLYEKGTSALSPSPTSAFEAYRKAAEHGDERVSERFPGLEDGPRIATAFLESWESNDYRETFEFLAEESGPYFHLENPDASQIGSLEKGFRDLWERRWISPGSARDVSLVALDRVRLEMPYELKLRRDHWEAEAAARAVVELSRRRDDTWKIARFEPEVKQWHLVPGAEAFETGDAEEPSSRGLLPAYPPEEATYDLTNLPRKQVERVKTHPFEDRFGDRHALLPTSFEDDLIVFARIVSGGDVLIPEAHFDPNALEELTGLIDSQSFGLFEKLAGELVDEPDTDDPATAALLRRANGGDHEAEALVGEHYYDGLGTFPVNRVEALKWFVKATKGGHPLGRIWIATMTNTGEISSSDSPTKIFRKTLYELATAISQDGAKAPYWRATAECYAGAEEIPLTTGKPEQLLDRAMDRGDTRARVLLGSRLLQSEDPTRGVRLLRYASDTGCATAATRLAKYYLAPGDDPRLVPGLLGPAARKHAIEAQLLLGRCHARGIGTDADPARAAFWLELGLRNAVRLAEEDLEVRIRQRIRTLDPVVGKDSFRRARNFLEKEQIGLGEPE